MTSVSRSSAGSHSHREAIDEILGTLADLHRIEADDLIGKPIRHFIQDGNASLGVKIPSLIDGAPADELFSQLGNLMLAVFDFGEEFPQAKRTRLRAVGQSVTAVIGEKLSPCLHIMFTARQSSGRAFLFLVTLQSSLGPSDKGGKFAESAAASGFGWW
jgi:hypothetical protein